MPGAHGDLWNGQRHEWLGEGFLSASFPVRRRIPLLPVGYKTGVSHVNVEAFIYPHIFTPAPCFCSQLYLAP